MIRWRAGFGVAEAAIEADVLKDQGGSVVTTSGRERTETVSIVQVFVRRAGR